VICVLEGSWFWKATTKNSPCRSVAILVGVVYAITYNFDGDGDLMALSLENGSPLREILWTDLTPTPSKRKYYVCGVC